jgi:dTMP kinase
MDETTKLHLHIAARNDHVIQVITPAIDQRKVILCDRYEASTYAYQIYAGGAGALLELPDSPSPDFQIWLDVDPSIAIERIDRRIEATKSKEVIPSRKYLETVQKGYKSFFNEYCPLDNQVIIDANCALTDVVTDCVDAIARRFRSVLI